jgi:hypothetical protein
MLDPEDNGEGGEATAVNSPRGKLQVTMVRRIGQAYLEQQLGALNHATSYRCSLEQ